jgi:hypothetical protein
MRKLLVVLVCLGLVGCNNNPYLVALDAAVAAADVAVTTLATQGGINPATAALVVSALAPIPNVANQIIAEAESKDDALTKANKIVALANPISNSLATLVPQVGLYVTATLTAWNAFIVSVQPTPAIPMNVPAVAKIVMPKPSSTVKSNVSLRTLKEHVSKLQADLDKARKK